MKLAAEVSVARYSARSTKPRAKERQDDMSRIGLRPIDIPSGVDINVDAGLVTVKGPKGELQQQVHPDMVLSRENGTLSVARPNDERMFRQLHGLTRTLI